MAAAMLEAMRHDLVRCQLGIGEEGVHKACDVAMELGIGAETIAQLGVKGRQLLSCLALLKTCAQRGDLLAWGVRSLHDEGKAGDDLVLELAGRCEKLEKSGEPMPEGIAAANGAGKTARPDAPDTAGPTARSLHDARAVGAVCDFFLAETLCAIKVEHEDFAAEEWDGAVCGYLDGWPPAGKPIANGEKGVDCLVAGAAATRMQSMARAFIAKRRLRARLQAVAEAARLEEEKRLKAETDAAAAKKLAEENAKAAAEREAAAASDAAATAAAAATTAAEAKSHAEEGRDAAAELAIKAASARDAAKAAAATGMRVGKEKSGEGDGADGEDSGANDSEERKAAKAALADAEVAREKAIADVAAAKSERETAEAAAAEAKIAAEAAVTAAETAAETAKAAEDASADDPEDEEKGAAFEAAAEVKTSAEAAKEKTAVDAEAAETAAAAAAKREEDATAVQTAAQEKAETASSALAEVVAAEEEVAAAAAAAAAEAEAAEKQKKKKKKQPGLSVEMFVCAREAKAHAAACREASDAAQLASQTYATSRTTAEEASTTASAAAEKAAASAAAAAAAAAESGGTVGEKVVPGAEAKVGDANASVAATNDAVAAAITALDALAASAAAALKTAEEAEEASAEIEDLATRTRDEEEANARNEAAVIIQAQVMCWILRLKYKRMKAAAVRIQTAGRMFTAFRRYARLKAAAVKINRVGRGHIGRQIVRRMRADIRKAINATLLIQSCLRGRIARRRAKASTAEKATCVCGRVASGEMLSCAQCCEFYHAHCVRSSRWRSGPDWIRAGRDSWTCPRCTAGSVGPKEGSGAATATAGGDISTSTAFVEGGGVRVGKRHNVDEPPLVLTYTRVAARDIVDLRALVSTEPGIAASQRGKTWRSGTRGLSAVQAAALAEKTSGGGGGGEDGVVLPPVPGATPAPTRPTRPTQMPPPSEEDGAVKTTTRKVADLALVDAAIGTRATSKGVHDRLRKIREKVVDLLDVETRLLDGLDHIEATALQGLPAPVNVDGVPWTATEAPEPEELIEALKGSKVKRMAPPAEIVLVGGGDGGTAAMIRGGEEGEGDNDDDAASESVAGKKEKKGDKKGGKGGTKASKAAEPGKAAKKLKAIVKAARKKKLGPIAKAAGLGGGGGGEDEAAASAGDKTTKAGVSMGISSKTGVQRRAPPPREAMDKLRKTVLKDWREQPATVEIVSGPGVVVAGAKSAQPVKTGKGAKGFVSRQDARGGPDVGGPKLSMGRVSKGSQAPIV